MSKPAKWTIRDDHNYPVAIERDGVAMCQLAWGDPRNARSASGLETILRTLNAGEVALSDSEADGGDDSDSFKIDGDQSVAWVDDENLEWPICIGDRGTPLRLKATEARKLARWLLRVDEIIKRELGEEEDDDGN